MSNKMKKADSKTNGPSEVQRAGVERDLREALIQNLGDDVEINSTHWDLDGYACMAVGQDPEPHGNHDAIAMAVYRAAPEWPNGRVEVHGLSLQECRIVLPILLRVVKSSDCGGEKDASRRDERQFLAWKTRVLALGADTAALGLTDDAYDERTPRHKLIVEIHEDVAPRFPLGIARDLSHVVDALNVEDDLEAAEILGRLAHEEGRSRVINGGA